MKTATQVKAWRLCIGCGACAYICPDSNIQLENVIKEGIRPSRISDDCRHCGKCAEVCPGLSLEHPAVKPAGLIKELLPGWGPILEVWEGHASDPEMRYMGSSGGVASALALFCVEKMKMSGVLHTGASEKSPLCNQTVFSKKRSEFLARTGSKYSPASPCDGFGRIEKADGQCVFVGKPCDLSGLRKARALKPELDEKIGLAIGIFCAGTPATQGTLDLLRKHGIAPDAVEEVRYRGKGWPGMFSVKLWGEESPHELLTYMQAWGFIQEYRPYRCYLCPDGTSEFADISCGDPWYREIKQDEAGHSLVLVRTETGRTLLQAAMRAGAVSLKQAPVSILEASQINLLNKRGAVGGRVFSMKMLGIPTPCLKGFSLFDNWLALSMAQKARSIIGTIRRCVQRKYFKPIQPDK